MSDKFGLRCGLIAGLVSVALVMPASVTSQPVGIPSMGAPSSHELSPALERTLGNAIMEQGRRDPDYINDPEVSQYLTDLGRELVKHAPAGASQHVTVFGLRDSSINAFALPGGYIGIHSGLIASARSESELVSVVAHEIAHVVQRHIARGMTQSSQSSHILLASLVGALLAGLAGGGDLAMGVAAFGQAAAIDRQLGFSRQAEQEADRVGFQMMSRAGYDPRGMRDMFARLASSSRLNEGVGGSVYTRTHPLSTQRLSDIESRIRGHGVTHADNPTFWYVRAKLIVLQARASHSAARSLEALERDATHAEGVQRQAARYGLAFAAFKQKQFDVAAEHLDHLSAQLTTSPEVAALAVAIDLERGRVAEALEASRQAWAQWPQSQSIAMVRAEALQKSGDDQKALAFLQERASQWPDIPVWHRLRAHSYERLDEPISARRAMAQYYEDTGALPTAVEHLQQARNLTADFYLQSELDVQIREIKERLMSQRALLKRFERSG
ncbi:MAG TPA: M48 family metalloprotease [Burkholderiaceae bacterium]|nr:M48 family metalloprotease [Burkholderiaceae bacterium]